MSFFDEIKFAAEEGVTPSATQEQGSQSDSDFFSTIRFAEDTSATATLPSFLFSFSSSSSLNIHLYFFLDQHRGLL